MALKMKIRKFDRDFDNAYLRVERVNVDRRGLPGDERRVNYTVVTYANDPNKGSAPEKLLPDRAYRLEGIPVGAPGDDGEVIERTPIDTNGNLFEQAYNELKTMEEFIDAEDV